MRNAKIKFMLVAMFTLLTVTLLSISCKVEDAAVKEWTVTIDPNNMTLGGTLKVTVKDGEKASLPGDIVPPADYEIPYYSTVKEDYSKVYDFANTAVTSDITVYPHYRFAADKAYKKLLGAWLDINSTSPEFNIILYKVSADNSLNAKCFAQNSGSNVDLSVTNNNLIRQGLVDLVVQPKTNDNPFGESEDSTNFSPAVLTCQLKDPVKITYKAPNSDILYVTGGFLFNYIIDQEYTFSIDTTRNLTFTSEDKQDVKKYFKVD